MRLKLSLTLLALILLVAAYFAFALQWSYSSGERAGWVQKLSHKGWICKTWEGELAMVTVPGSSAVEKFYFTVRDPAVAESINKVMGKRVNLHYEQKVGLPTECFGETRYFVTRVTETGEVPMGLGVPVPTAVPPQVAPVVPVVPVAPVVPATPVYPAAPAASR